MAFGASVLTAHAETVKIAFMDPLSGPFANVGQNQLKSWQFIADYFNKKDPKAPQFEIVSFDNKGSPQESLNTLKAAVDQGIRYVTQGNGSGAAAAILDAVQKHNERNPGKEVVYLNYAAVDPALTNEKCSYWHFRLDADTTMKMEALTSFMKDQPEIKKVYIIGQNYSHGQQVAKYFKEYIARKRPDIQIVGDDLHPHGPDQGLRPLCGQDQGQRRRQCPHRQLGHRPDAAGQGRQRSRAERQLLHLLRRCQRHADGLASGTTGKVRVVAYAHNNLPGLPKQLQDDFKKKFNDDWYTAATYNGLAMLSDAFKKAKSTDPVKVAAAMDGMRFEGFVGEVEMRKSDHQLQQPLYISEWAKADAKHPYSVENTGFNFREVKAIPAYVASTPTSCQMKRPLSRRDRPRLSHARMQAAALPRR